MLAPSTGGVCDGRSHAGERFGSRGLESRPPLRARSTGSAGCRRESVDAVVLEACPKRASAYSAYPRIMGTAMARCSPGLVCSA